MARWNFCNVLDAHADARRVWQFDANKFALKGEQVKYPGEALPGKMVAKNWRSLFQPKMNIALLPPEDVFLRVIHLPKASLDETISMVELQLEKISPTPVAQIVWTLHILPHSAEGMQTVLVVVVGRSAVEQFLGKLEGESYITDRLEVSFLEQLLSTKVAGNGAWVYPAAHGAKNSAFVAWWYDGVLRSVDLISLPVGGLNAANLRDQLRQMTWAGELDGWLTAPPTWHLVADDATALDWAPILRESVDTTMEKVSPLNLQEIAALTARRGVTNPSKVNLLPPEYGVRYRQQFIDRLWMGGLFAVAGIYLVGVVIYFASLQVLTYRADKVDSELAGISNTYTNAIELKARFAVLKDRSELKYAALNCWQAVASLLPDSMTIDSMNFNNGQKLILNGTSSGDANEVLDFSEVLRKTTNEDQALFNQQTSDQFATQRGNTWSYSLDLKRTEDGQ
ncbi:MAG TPA: hypothetical protein VH255_10030 [Verrucomicrobiae bacterium]|jgi:hypothetical protein|nr:hypothetical protein [Verrucomicrobiae bacterium]